jgi:hypothetical protein
VWIERPVLGRLAGAKCQVQTTKNRGAKTCRRWGRVASPLQISGANGTNRLHISGRANGKRLVPGSYRLALRPEGAVTRRAFTILP